MCGIAATPTGLDLAPAVKALAHRGPDASAITDVAGVTLGHTRLAIQDPQPRSDQPYTWGPVTVAYNGELFNTEQVKAALPVTQWATSGDTEVVAAALGTVGPGTALPLLDGMFALAWADERTPGVLHLARDRHGEIPLHLHRSMVAASELKALTALGLSCGDVVDIPAGEWWQVTKDGAVAGQRFAQVTASPGPGKDASARVWAALGVAVQRRAISDVPVCTLLSGGIDSAVITAVLARIVPGLVSYTAVLDKRSRDLRCAREVAEYLGIKLVEVPVPVPTADDLASVVHQIELPHKAQVEIGWACLHLAAAMHGDGFKVTYSGEGSDELWASYGFAYHAVAQHGWYEARARLVRDQARKNFPRVNKAFMSAGVEARLPFLDPGVVALALSLPQDVVTGGKAHAKRVLSDAYEGSLPSSVLHRPKVAFQDGMGLKAACAAVVANPGRFYRAEYARAYG